MDEGEDIKQVTRWVPVDILPKESTSREIRLGEQLPPEYQEVLDELRVDIPKPLKIKQSWLHTTSGRLKITEVLLMKTEILLNKTPRNWRNN